MADAKTEKQKVKEITDKLEEGLKELFESEKYKSYLSTMSKFHNYSFNNTLLIALQKPEATLVAGYQAWQKNFKRHVNKGEKGIRILAPAPYKIKEERDKLDPVTGEIILDKDGLPQTEEVEIKIPAFREVSVFDISQTDGEPIPKLEAKELLSTVEGYEDFIKAITYVAPAPIGFEDIPGDSKGYFDTVKNRIAVQEGMSESQTLKTMVHETAHSMLHNREVNKEDILVSAKDMNTIEVEAESVAYTVCQHFGIDTSEYSFGYIAGWSSGKDMKELKSSLDTIRRTASELITGIEEQLKELQRDREIMREQEKESLLLIQNSDLSEYSLVSVRGMDAAEVVEALSAMNDDDRLNVAAYLESRGVWTTEIANEETREFGEYHLDVRYITDTNKIIDLKAEMEWNERELRSMQAELAESGANKEAQLLYGDTDKYGIYQLKDNPELRDFHFVGTESLKRRGIIKGNFDAIKPENYNLVYVGELSELSKDFISLPTQGDTLEALYEKFNIDHPEDFKGHSLSVSDIVVLHKNGENSAHFVESVGFTRLPDFMRELEGVKEQDAQKAELEEMQDTSGYDVQRSEKENTPEYIYQIEANPRSDNFKNRYFLQAYEVEELGKAIPRDVLYVGTMEKCRELMGQLVSGEMTQSSVKKLFSKSQETPQEPEQAGEEKYPAVYHKSLNYARNHGEVDEYLKSRKLDMECKRAIEEIIRQNFDGMYLKGDIVKPLVEQYGSERIAFVLANTLQQESWDGRFSMNNKAWASESSISENIVHGTDMNVELIVSSHPAVLDGFIDMFRKEVLEQEKELSTGQEKVTSGHDVQKLETERQEPEQTQAEQTEAEKAETQKSAETPQFEDIDEDDEIIDLGDEKDQVLAEMKQSLEGRQDTFGYDVQKLETEPEEMVETALAFQIADRYISIQETEGGYDYSIMGADYKEIDGGVYDNPDVSIREALNDIVEDLKENPFDNGAKGNIGDNDELIPIDYDGLMDKVEAANRIEPQAQGNVVENFKAKTNELFREIGEMNPAEIEETVKCHVQAQLDEYGIDAVIVDAVVSGSRCRGLEREGSDLDVVVELSTDEREDVLFDMINGDELHIGGVKVDINPITAQRTGILETYLPQVEDYLEGVREARENEPISIFNIRMNDEERWFKNISGLDAEGLCKAYVECGKPFVEMGKYGERIAAADHANIEQGDRLDFSIEFNEETDQITIFDGQNIEHKGLRTTLFPEQAEPEVTLIVAECGELPNSGEYYDNISTVDEAIAIWRQIPPERMHGIPAIDINIHMPGTEPIEDETMIILLGEMIDLESLDDYPNIKGNAQAMELITELVAKLPDMEIAGTMSREMEEAVWEKRMPDLTSAEQLSVEIHRFLYTYDWIDYDENAGRMTESVSCMAESISQNDTFYITEWLTEVITEGMEPEETRKAMELLEKLAEYKPLAKIEEMEEQNYNMIDNVSNNGAGEKIQKEDLNKRQEVLMERTSLRARLAEKKEIVSGQGKDRESQENMKNERREM